VSWINLFSNEKKKYQASSMCFLREINLPRIQNLTHIKWYFFKKNIKTLSYWIDLHKLELINQISNLGFEIVITS